MYHIIFDTLHVALLRRKALALAVNYLCVKRHGRQLILLTADWTGFWVAWVQREVAIPATDFVVTILRVSLGRAVAVADG